MSLEIGYTHKPGHHHNVAPRKGFERSVSGQAETKTAETRTGRAKIAASVDNSLLGKLGRPGTYVDRGLNKRRRARFLHGSRRLSPRSRFASSRTEASSSTTELFDISNRLCARRPRDSTDELVVVVRNRRASTYHGVNKGDAMEAVPPVVRTTPWFRPPVKVSAYPRQNRWTGRFPGGVTGNVISGRDGIVCGGGVRGLNSRRLKSVADEGGVVGGWACSGWPHVTLGISTNSRKASAATMPLNRHLDEPV